MRDGIQESSNVRWDQSIRIWNQKKTHYLRSLEKCRRTQREHFSRSVILDLIFLWTEHDDLRILSSKIESNWLERSRYVKTREQRE